MPDPLSGTDNFEHHATQVLVVGSGPTGSTYAKKCVDAGIDTIMIDMGAQETRIPGEHKKNVITFQKNMNSFINVIQGELTKLSVPTQEGLFPTLDPTAFSSRNAVMNGQNPKQDPTLNLDNSAVTRSVGGMANHWTCCTPEPLPGVERPDTFDDAKWKALYTEARELIHTPIDAEGEGTQFEDSIRQQLVKRHLLKAFESEKRVFKAMPLACQRRSDNPDWVDWSSSSTVLGHIATDLANQKPVEHFSLWAEHQCTDLVRDPNTGNVMGAVVVDLRTKKRKFVTAERYVVCAGAVLTTQILTKSGFKEHLPALGHYLTEQTMTFCQIVLKNSLIEPIRDLKDPYGLGWPAKVEKHLKKYPFDPLPFPFNDYDPQVTTPLTKEYPWHTQIHRDAFSYGLVPDTYDQRVIVDLRWFGYVVPTFENRVEFADPIHHKDEDDVSPGITDAYGMPQPTFFFALSEDDKDRASKMMSDMCRVAEKLGGFLPGALPQFMPPGSALHICGITRVGTDAKNSCVDAESRVHGSKNLFLGGCNVIPTQIACNPTLTAICYAIVGADAIVADLKAA